MTLKEGAAKCGYKYSAFYAKAKKSGILKLGTRSEIYNEKEIQDIADYDNKTTTGEYVGWRQKHGRK